MEGSNTVLWYCIKILYNKTHTHTQKWPPIIVRQVVPFSFKHIKTLKITRFNDFPHLTLLGHILQSAGQQQDSKSSFQWGGSVPVSGCLHRSDRVNMNESRCVWLRMNLSFHHHPHKHIQHMILAGCTVPIYLVYKTPPVPLEAVTQCVLVCVDMSHWEEMNATQTLFVHKALS